MDYSIVLVIKKDDLTKIGLVEEITSWGDEVISFSPRRFHSEDDVKLIEIESDAELDNLITLEIVRELRELEWQANRSREKFKKNNIMKLLEKICRLSYFNIIMKEDDANIEKEIEYNYKNCSAIYGIIADSLNWDNPKNLKICNQILI